MNDFKSLGLAESLLASLRQANYATPTPIQVKAIPLVIDGSDLLGIAQTGTGKTAAFALPVLHRLAKDRRAAPRGGCRVLVLAPTRELAAQIGESFRVYGRHLGFEVATIFGGVSPRAQRQVLARGSDVLVATPGRLIDHMGAGDARLDKTEILVIDEADQMLDLGFVKDMRRIVSELPQRRQTLFFSATMPTAVNHLAAAFLNSPKRVAVAPGGTTTERVRQRVIHVRKDQKRACLKELIADSGGARTLIFTRTKRGADKVAKDLAASGLRVAAMHGDKSQNQRERILKAFRNATIDILIATDIAARGIDIDGIQHVINYELPDVPEAYVHRIGRTARAGASGRATSLCGSLERRQLREIEKLTRQTIKSEVHTEGVSETGTPTAQAAQPGPGKPATKTKQAAAGKSGSNGHWWERATPKAQRGKSAPRGRRRSARATAPAPASCAPA